MRSFMAMLLLVGVGCLDTTSVISSDLGSVEGEPRDLESTEAIQPLLPVDGSLIYKGFGEYFEDRFSGYNVGIDLEAPADTPVYAVEGGEVTYGGWVSGYGGVMIVKTIMSDRTKSVVLPRI